MAGLKNQQGLAVSMGERYTLSPGIAELIVCMLGDTAKHLRVHLGMNSLESKALHRQ